MGQFLNPFLKGIRAPLPFSGNPKYNHLPNCISKQKGKPITKTNKNHEETKMAERLEIYKCEVCNNIIEVLHGGKGELVCCKQPMKLLKENTVDAAKEKHVPVIEKTDKGFKVKVGAVAHPMEEKHYIEWIELLTGGNVYRQFLKPGDAPEAVFETTSTKASAREYCSLHALWKV